MKKLPQSQITLVPREIEAYAEAHSTPPSPVCQDLIKATLEQTGSDANMQVGHLEGSFLKFLVRISGARSVLEIGRFTGGSTAAMAEELPKDGRIFTVDIDDGKTYRIAQEHWQRSPDNHSKIRSFIGDARTVIPTILGKFDIVFIDADKKGYSMYWDLVVTRIKKGGLIIADNTLWEGRVLRPRRQSDKAIVAFNKKVRADKRFDVLLLPIRDGVTLAIKN